MRSWQSISVATLMGVSAIALSACEEQTVDTAIFDSLQQCINEPGMLREDCEKSQAEARSQHTAVAPKYTSVQDCQADFGAGRCEQAPYRSSTGGSIFMPLMMGYMMGSMLNGRRMGGSQPLYRSASDPKSYRTADNRSAGAKTGRTQVARSAASRPSVKTSTIRRGGFGSSGRRFGSAAT
ncbi:MAG: DUF1190 domain-containing protein [Rhodospirillaceae bacterium]|jgi:uncharacterized protein YgiB involved in biofilm formation|nr:DUF1190 domain-containing protein [Rhodospirillaceae bacterium]MBT5048771.1 DUF1190 domain-containing protein [Rhodospirillaceae bacterium]MBT5459223.1 DUF1190 domain-containing protein [Rhodospirillaceae bacterium]